MKPFAIFGFDDYYPSGGMNDLISVHDTLEEAIAELVDVKIKGIPTGATPFTDVCASGSILHRDSVPPGRRASYDNLEIYDLRDPTNRVWPVMPGSPVVTVIDKFPQVVR